MYESWIVDECGYEICKVADLSSEQLNEMMDNHPKYSIKCICIE